jgi:hypothetical protein
LHWGVFRHLRREVQANDAVFLGAIALDAVFLVIKAQSAPLIIVVSIVGTGSIFVLEAMFLRPRREAGKVHSGHR